MEDRHTLSEPRLKTYNSSDDDNSTTQNHSNENKPVWQVDIYRKGVTDPVDTIDLDDSTLPPRMRKGKVVWRLPSSADRMPSFGTYEVRRILDIFKERKKNRRKTKSSKPSAMADATPTPTTSTNQGISSDTTKHKPIMNGSSHGSNHTSITSGGESTSEMDSNAIGSGGVSQWNGHTKAPPSGVRGRNTIDDSITSTTNGTTTKKLKEKKKKKRADARNLSPSSGNTRNSAEEINGQRKGDQSSNTMKRQLHSSSSSRDAPPPPPGLGTSSTTHSNHSISDNPSPPTPHERQESTRLPEKKSPERSDGSKSGHSTGSPIPPGLHLPTSKSTDDESKLKHMPISNSSLHSEPSMSSEQSMPTSLPPGFTGMAQPISRYITIPERYRPQSQPPFSKLQEEKKSANDPSNFSKQSLSIPAAKAFIDIYYTHITHGLSNDLTMYYTEQAQKSVSVGGAHSVVASREKITHQLSSLAGSVFTVRGVVAQDTFDSGGVHLLISGLVETVNSQLSTTFAHSVILVPAKSILNNAATTGTSTSQSPTLPNESVPFSFQIHNDALSLLTMGDMNTTPSPTTNTATESNPTLNPTSTSNGPSMSPWHENRMGMAPQMHESNNFSVPERQSSMTSRLY